VDYTVNAATGFPLITGPEEHAGPVNHVLPAWDVACGLYAALGLLAAERHRRRTGEGRAITLALEDVALAVAGHLGFLAEAQLTKTDRPRIGNHLYGGFARDFAIADGTRIMLVALTGRHFGDLAAVTGLAGPFAELGRLLSEDFSCDGDRYAHREVIASLLAPWFSQRTLADLTGDPGFAANTLLGEIDQPGVGRLLAPGPPLAQPGVGAVQPAPALGENTVAVLTELLGLPAETARTVASAATPVRSGPGKKRELVTSFRLSLSWPAPRLAPRDPNRGACGRDRFSRLARHANIPIAEADRTYRRLRVLALGRLRCIPVAHAKRDHRPVRRLTIEAAVRLRGSVSRPAGPDRAPIRPS
jgi:hypothetical protein